MKPDIQKQILEALDSAVKEREMNKSFLKSIGPAIVEILRPILSKIAESARLTKEDITTAMSGIRVEINPEIKVPEIRIPDIHVPEVRVPKPEVHVNVPEIKLPSKFNLDFPKNIKVLLDGVDRKNPLPVMMVDLEGNPYFPSYQGGGGGGSGPSVITDITTPGGRSILDDSPIKAIRTEIVDASGAQIVSFGGTQYNDGATPDQSGGSGIEAMAFDGSGSIFALRVGPGVSDKALRVIHATDAADSVNVVQIGGTNVDTGSGASSAGSMRIMLATDSILSTHTATDADVSEPIPALASRLQGWTTSVWTRLRAFATSSDGVSTQTGGALITQSYQYAFNGSTFDRLRNSAGEGNALRVQMANDAVASTVVNSGTLTGITNTLTVDQLSGANWSVTASQAGTWNIGTVTSITNSVASALIDSTGVQYSGSNPVPITIVSGSSGGTQYNDSATPDQSGGVLTLAGGFDGSGSVFSLRLGTGVSDKALRVVQASDVVSSVAITGINSPVGAGDSSAALRILQAGDAVSSVNLLQVNGTTADTNTGASSAGTLRTILASNTVLSTQTITDGVANADATISADFTYGYNGSTWDRVHTNAGDSAGALRTTPATDAVSSVVVNSGTLTSLTQFNGNAISTNDGEASPGTLRVIHAADIGSSVIINGVNDSMMVHMARTTLPTAKSDGADVRPMADKYGRQTMRLIQVRDLVSTAYLSKSTGSTFGTETTLLAATAGQLNDLVWILATNDSSAAIQADLRAVTAGNVILTFIIPSGGTTGVAPPVPIPQTDTGNNWTIDLPDVTGTNCTFTAMFTREQ